MRLKVLILCICWVGPCAAQTEFDYSRTSESNADYSENHPARAWGLTEREWTAVDELRVSNKGMISDQLTPLEMLGIFSTSLQDRERYATMFAQRQIELLDAIAEFETAYAEAIRKLTAEKSARQTDRNRIVLITPYQCQSASCRHQLDQAVVHATKGTFVDIVIRERLTELQSRIWAEGAKIPRQLIRSGQITINHSRGRPINLPDGFIGLSK